MLSAQLTEATRSQEATRVTWVGFVVNAVLTALKIAAGIQAKSAAMVADGVHSLSDFFTDVVVLVGFKLTEKPADDQHNYGHGKYETLATVIISMALIFVGFSIFTSGAKNIYAVLFQGKVLGKPGIAALAAAAVSIVGKEWLYRYTRTVGDKINSSAVIANGWHHRSDAFSSFGTFIGIGGAIFLGDKWTILDPIASVVVSVFIFKVALQIFGPAINELMESSLAEDELCSIREIIMDCPDVRSHHHLRTRRVGSRTAIEVHVILDQNITVREAHDLVSGIESRLRARFGDASIITTHVEPYHPSPLA